MVATSMVYPYRRRTKFSHRKGATQNVARSHQSNDETHGRAWTDEIPNRVHDETSNLSFLKGEVRSILSPHQQQKQLYQQLHLQLHLQPPPQRSGSSCWKLRQPGVRALMAQSRRAGGHPLKLLNVPAGIGRGRGTGSRCPLALGTDQYVFAVYAREMLTTNYETNLDRSVFGISLRRRKRRLFLRLSCVSCRVLIDIKASR